MAHLEESLGRSIPAETPHAVSVSLPTWRANVGYEEGEDWVLSKLTTGYPRFFINEKITQLSNTVLHKLNLGGQAMLFPVPTAARRCLDFIRKTAGSNDSQSVRVVDYVCIPSRTDAATSYLLQFSAVIFPPSCFKAAKAFWQHSGEGISSRRAEYYKEMVDEGQMVPKDYAEAMLLQAKGPKRYRKQGASTPHLKISSSTGEKQPNPLVPTGSEDIEHNDQTRFVEERFGRNLDLDHAKKAKVAIRRRISGSLNTDSSSSEISISESDPGYPLDRVLSLDDVYLYSCGMNSIYTTYRMIMSANDDKRRSICFGFPYLDTLKVLQKFGPGCLFYGHGTSEDLDDLDQRLQNGERFTSLFCEFPSNPLLRSPDLERIRSLADQYGFVVVIDETIGNFLNVHVLPYADVLVSSLTKIFSGDSNVMGGSAILNPKGHCYSMLKRIWEVEYQDLYWPEDAIFMERNSRDFVSRIERINVNAEAICLLLEAHPRVKQVYYPKISPTRPNYERCRTGNGGYGGLLSATFRSTEDVTAFYDNLDTEKGPSLGTNFTLASPFVLIAHYTELDWAAQYGVEKNLIRFSVGLEDTAALQKKIAYALAALPS